MLYIYFDNMLLFFERGGTVLFAIFLISLCLWTLLIERYVYIKFLYKKEEHSILDDLNLCNSEEKFKKEIKKFIIESSKIRLKKGMSIIKILIIICPLVGLLGTVTGMMEVFGQMSVLGSSDVKSMANGVSMATIPTMAGMVVALSGILFEKKLDSSICSHIHKLYFKISKVLK